MLKAYRSLKDIEKDFFNDERCLDYIRSIKWKNGVVSPFDPSSPVTRVDDRWYLCKSTQKRFTVTTQTIFSGTKSALQDWFKVIWLMTANPDISSSEIARRARLNQKTVWNFKRKIEMAQKA